MKFIILLFLIALIGMLWGRGRFLKIYGQESKNITASRITGSQLVVAILQKKGISGYTLQKSSGLLPDFYEPSTRRISLAPQHFDGASFSALAIAALQAGKAIQHVEGHRPLLWRTAAIKWSVQVAPPLALVGLITLVIGKLLFPAILLLWTLIALWNMLTTPTEIDAGMRAKRALDELRILRNLDESVGVNRVIGAASTAYIDGISVMGTWIARFLPWGYKVDNTTALSSNGKK